MKKLSLFVSVVALLAVSTSYATINCESLPSCESMGFTESRSSNCPKYTTCPSDENKIACDHVALIGEIRPWAGKTIPAGWLKCDGKDYAKTDYSALYAAIGDTFGTINNRFKVPDLRGRVPVSVNADSSSFTKYSMGNTGGEEVHYLTINEMPSHTHSYKAPITSGDHDGGSDGYDRPNALEDGTTGATGGLYHENRMPYLAVQYIIYSGVY